MLFRIALECKDHDDNGEGGFESALIREEEFPDYAAAMLQLNRVLSQTKEDARDICRAQGRPSGNYQINVSNAGSRELGKSLAIAVFEYTAGKP